MRDTKTTRKHRVAPLHAAPLFSLAVALATVLSACAPRANLVETRLEDLSAQSSATGLSPTRQMLGFTERGVLLFGDTHAVLVRRDEKGAVRHYLLPRALGRRMAIAAAAERASRAEEAGRRGRRLRLSPAGTEEDLLGKLRCDAPRVGDAVRFRDADGDLRLGLVIDPRTGRVVTADGDTQGSSAVHTVRAGQFLSVYCLSHPDLAHVGPRSEGGER